jgi:hypothetical protein
MTCESVRKGERTSTDEHQARTNRSIDLCARSQPDARPPTGRPSIIRTLRRRRKRASVRQVSRERNAQIGRCARCGRSLRIAAKFPNEKKGYSARI